MKRNIIFAIGLFLLLSIAGNASADNEGNTFAKIWMVRGDKQTDPVDPANFAWDETPWLYLNLPTAPDLFGWKSKVTSDWLFDSVSQGSSDSDVNAKSYWLKLDDWNAVKQAGIWTVNAGYEYYMPGEDSVFGYGYTTFNVNAVPEPISSTLFLIGAGALSAWRIRRKKIS